MGAVQIVRLLLSIANMLMRRMNDAQQQRVGADRLWIEMTKRLQTHVDNAIAAGHASELASDRGGLHDDDGHQIIDNYRPDDTARRGGTP